MKKKFYAKVFSLAAMAALSLALLTGCGSTPSEQTATAGLSGAGQTQTAGTLLLSVNPEIEVTYDDQGNVTALTGVNQEGKDILASYTGFEGKPCKTVVSELVAAINQAGYFDVTIDGHEKNIVLKVARGSQYPSDDFLSELTAAIQALVAADNIGSQMVLLDEDDYDDAYGDKGYINAQAAQNILSAQLGRDDIQFVEKEYDLDDGDYEVEFVLDGVEYEYEVNAVTGKMYHSTCENYYRQIRGVSDQLCKAHGLSIILESDEKKSCQLCGVAASEKEPADVPFYARSGLARCHRGRQRSRTLLYAHGA